MEEKILEQETTNNPDKVIWESSCHRINKGFVKFIACCLVSLIILSLSCYKLIMSSPDEDKSIYISMISLVLGLFFPSPSLK